MVHPGDDESKQVLDLNPKLWDKAGTENSSKDDVVTLTKSQLRAILEAIGQVGTLSINDTKPSGQVLGEAADGPSSAYFAAKNLPKLEPQANGSHSSSSGPSASEPLGARCPLDILPSTFSQQQHWSSNTQQHSPTKQALSKLEQKRMQWEMERAENNDWYPWGRPGAGAPTHRALPIASIAPRTDHQQFLNVQTTVPYSSSHAQSFPGGLNSPCRDPNGNKTTIASCNYVTQPIRRVPPVFRSSIAFGADDADSMNDERTKKEQWLRDLEIQREEQRLRKLAEQDHLRSNGQIDSHSLNGFKEDLDSISISIDGSVAPIGAENQPGGRSHVRGQGFRTEVDPNSAARAEERRLKAQECQLANQKQMEEKRRRDEEAKRKKLEQEREEERRLQLEREELQKQYEREQESQKLKMELKETKQNLIMSAIAESEAQAAAAKKAKRVNRLQALGDDDKESELNHLVASPRRSPIAVTTYEKPPLMSHKESPRPAVRDEHENEGLLMEVRTVQQTATVKPLQVSKIELTQKSVVRSPSPDDSTRREISVQTAKPLSDDCEGGYVVNRVLTPSCDRIKKRLEFVAKDFGTQTDMHYGKSMVDDAESTDQSNTSYCTLGKRPNRVQHSKPYKAARHHGEGGEQDLAARPKWGVNQPSKAYICMTDRDPHFSKRKKLQELRKQHWEREIAEQQALRNAKRSVGSLYPPLERRRVKSSSDGTMGGFSSSDFETSEIGYLCRLNSQKQGSSPPRRHHRTLAHRSTCGSVEDMPSHSLSTACATSLLPSMLRTRRDSQSSDNLPSIIGGSEPAPSRLNERLSFPEASSCSGHLPPMRRKWRSQDTFYPNSVRHLLNVSPPVPTLQHQMLNRQNSSTLTSPMVVHSRRKWSDQESFDIESVALSHAKSRPSSSEDGGSDANAKDSLSSAGSSRKSKTSIDQNPLVHPEVITGRPTPRQDRILQNLSSLREGLLLKQRELENLMRNPPHIS